MATVIASRNLSLADIQTLVDQQESILGPLVSIGNDGNENLLLFDVEQDPPERHPFIDTNIAPRPGAAVVATGKMFISGQLQDVAAFRSN